MRRFRDTEYWKWIRTAIEILLIAAAVCLLVYAYTSAGFAGAESLYWEAYVICMPGDEVNIRIKPSRSSESLGRYECGEMILLDGKKRNGFLHCVNLGLEMDNGWIRGYRAYVSDDREKWGEPVASGEFTSEQGGDEIRVEFAKPAKGRYLKLECLGEWRGRAYCAIAELSALVE